MFGQCSVQGSQVSKVLKDQENPHRSNWSLAANNLLSVPLHVTESCVHWCHPVTLNLKRKITCWPLESVAGSVAKQEHQLRESLVSKRCTLHGHQEVEGMIKVKVGSLSTPEF